MFTNTVDLTFGHGFHSPCQHLPKAIIILHAICRIPWCLARKGVRQSCCRKSAGFESRPYFVFYRHFRFGIAAVEMGKRTTTLRSKAQSGEKWETVCLATTTERICAPSTKGASIYMTSTGYWGFFTPYDPPSLSAKSILFVRNISALFDPPLFPFCADVIYGSPQRSIWTTTAM